MSRIIFFDELSKTDAHIAGGKGASLGEMTQAGIPVPSGFVVTAEAFDQFLEKTDLNIVIDAIMDTVDKEAIHTIEKASADIQALILEAEMPEDMKDEILDAFDDLGSEFVAVRSSATAEDSAEHAWAGQLDSFLNTKKEKVVETVQKCWASLFTPRAIFYRFEKDLNATKISVAVVVQKMVNSDKSGIAFSVHPVTEDPNQLIIEAGFGLGEALVAGEITPDAYVVEKDKMSILDINVSGDKQVLTEKEILELSNLVMKIESHYGFPCDIEWAIEGGKFYIVQSRAITTLSKGDLNKENRVDAEQYKNINSDNYDFLWTVGFPYIYCSAFLESGYTDIDAIAFNDKDTYTQFISKKDREKLSARGIDLYAEGFQAYEDYINSRRLGIEKEFERLSEFDLVKSGNADLADQFSKVCRLFIEVFKDYFVTEYHHADKVAEVLENKDSRFNLKLIEKNVKKMGDLKLLQRELINKFIYSPSLFEKYFNEITKRLKLKYDIKFYHYKEIINLLNGKYIEVPDRTVGVIRGQFSDNKDILGEEAEKIFLNLQKIDKNIDFIKGNIGHKGFHQGSVKVIAFSIDTDFKKEIDEMEIGQVLVSGSTGPEMILACKKAGAIITDEGGIMSHAAIISRELGIPCIIGTKIATKVLKDGDMVEVDANKGVVRIL